MAFTQRIVALAAVVAVPLGIAATSHVLTSGPDQPDVPRQVRLDEPTEPPTPTPTPTPTSTPTPDANQQDGKRGKGGSDEVVPRPKPTSSDDNGGAGGDDQADDGAGDDGAGDDRDDADDGDDG